VSGPPCTAAAGGAASTVRNVNAVVGVLGVTVTGILCLWIPAVLLGVPMPKEMLASEAINTVWQTAALGVFPYLWAIRRLGLTLADLGISLRRLGTSTVLGCSLYCLALVAFIHCSAGSLMQNHPIRHVPLGEAVVLSFFMAVIAGGTDILTRGFILLTLARYSHVVFAIAMQNLVWFLGHVHEIRLLADCLGVGGAAALTLTLGVLGDAVVLRTRNVVGLSIAHVLLNVVLTVYLRTM
jgi:hypothetical protein